MSGKRAGTRRASGPPPPHSRGLFGPALGITLALVAWGYLVYAAIEFGSAARAGDGAAWLMLALATLGAAACLFVGLMMISRLAAALGIGGTAEPRPRQRRSHAGPDAAEGDPATTYDPSTWDHTRPQAPGGRRRIVPSVGGAPADAPADRVAARVADSGTGRQGGSRASRQVRTSRRDRPAGGRRAAR